MGRLSPLSIPLVTQHSRPCGHGGQPPQTSSYSLWTPVRESFHRLKERSRITKRIFLFNEWQIIIKSSLKVCSSRIWFIVLLFSVAGQIRILFSFDFGTLFKFYPWILPSDSNIIFRIDSSNVCVTTFWIFYSFSSCNPTHRPSNFRLITEYSRIPLVRQ